MPGRMTTYGQVARHFTLPPTVVRLAGATRAAR